MTAAIDTDTSTEADDTTTPEAAVETDEQPDDAENVEPEADDTDEPDADAETFTRTYVEKLRRENQRYRERAGEADGLAQRLHTALVAATGKLADPTDLEFDAAHLDDEDALTAAIDDLLTAKPHLRNRRPMGDIGQGATRSDEAVDLAGILRSRA